jgi:phosphoglycolate phosphatase
MRELLGQLCRERPLAIATAKAHAIAVPLLDALDLGGFFTVVSGPHLDSLREPKSATVRRALSQLPEAAAPVMVGDREHDVIAAHDNGLPAIGVLWGIGSETELRTAGADTLVRTPAELARILEAPAPRRPA